jgi:hypothetical protein
MNHYLRYIPRYRYMSLVKVSKVDITYQGMQHLGCNCNETETSQILLIITACPIIWESGIEQQIYDILYNVQMVDLYKMLGL